MTELVIVPEVHDAVAGDDQQHACITLMTAAYGLGNEHIDF